MDELSARLDVLEKRKSRSLFVIQAGVSGQVRSGHRTNNPNSKINKEVTVLRNACRLPEDKNGGILT
jgi:hypothetical protein